MVNELLDFHRAEVKSAQLRTTYTSIPEYVSDIYEEFKGWAEASDIHVNLQIDNPEIGMWDLERRIVASPPGLCR